MELGHGRRSHPPPWSSTDRRPHLRLSREVKRIWRAFPLVLLLSVTLLGFLPRPALALDRPNGTLAAPTSRHLDRCRGSTRAHVAITWPTPADQATNRRLHWGAHLPAGIRRWAYLIVPDASVTGVDPYLVAGVMQVESHGDPLVWNLDSDARGLMQVLHASFEPAVNLRLGVSMLSDLSRRFGNRDLAIAGYNAGPGAVEQYGGIPPYAETRDYVIMVDYYRDLYAGLHLSTLRTSRFRAAYADLRAYYRRICGRP